MDEVYSGASFPKRTDEMSKLFRNMKWWRGGQESAKTSPCFLGETPPGLRQPSLQADDWYQGQKWADQLTSGVMMIKFMGLTLWNSLGRIPLSCRIQEGRGTHPTLRCTTVKRQTFQICAYRNAPIKQGNQHRDPLPCPRSQSRVSGTFALCHSYKVHPNTLLLRYVLSQLGRREQSPIKRATWAKTRRPGWEGADPKQICLVVSTFICHMRKGAHLTECNAALTTDPRCTFAEWMDTVGQALGRMLPCIIKSTT